MPQRDRLTRLMELLDGELTTKPVHVASTMAEIRSDVNLDTVHSGHLRGLADPIALQRSSKIEKVSRRKLAEAETALTQMCVGDIEYHGSYVAAGRDCDDVVRLWGFYGEKDNSFARDWEALHSDSNFAAQYLKLEAQIGESQSDGMQYLAYNKYVTPRIKSSGVSRAAQARLRSRRSRTGAGVDARVWARAVPKEIVAWQYRIEIPQMNAFNLAMRSPLPPETDYAYFLETVLLDTTLKPKLRKFVEYRGTYLNPNGEGTNNYATYWAYYADRPVVEQALKAFRFDAKGGLTAFGEAYAFLETSPFRVKQDIVYKRLLDVVARLNSERQLTSIARSAQESFKKKG